MDNCIEKRKFKRVKANLELKVSSLFKQDNVVISDIDQPIKVVNISKGGISFESKSILPLDYYFNASLQLGSEEDVLYSVVKIIRCVPIENSELYSYGCQFVGMAPILDYIFEEYEAEVE